MDRNIDNCVGYKGYWAIDAAMVAMDEYTLENGCNATQKRNSIYSLRSLYSEIHPALFCPQMSYILVERRGITIILDQIIGVVAEQTEQDAYAC